jgi:hypothetical protein
MTSLYNLPFNIIDKIILSNANYILTTYNNILDSLESARHISKRKRGPLIKSKSTKKHNDLLDYLINNKQYYISKSPIYKYMNNCNNANKIYQLFTKYIKKINIDSIDSIDSILEYDNDNIDSNDLTERLENNINLLVRLFKLSTYEELPDIIKVFILLRNTNYIELEKKFLDIIQEYHNNRIAYVESFLYCQNMINSYDYLMMPEYKFIPLFKINLGMGYDFIIGCDIILDRLIGFIEGGSCGQEYEYNRMQIEKYLKMNKQQRQNKYNTHIKKSYKIHNDILQNIERYLKLFNENLENIPNIFSYFSQNKLNILDN